MDQARSTLNIMLISIYLDLNVQSDFYHYKLNVISYKHNINIHIKNYIKHTHTRNMIFCFGQVPLLFSVSAD